MQSKTKILLKGSLFRTFYFFTSATIGLFLMPFIIHSLGNELYGLWVFATSLMGFYLLFDMGLSSAVQRYVSRAVGENNVEDANVIVNTSFFMFMIIGVFVLVLSFFVAFFLPSLVKNITEIGLFRNVMMILGANLALSIPMRVFAGVLTAHLRFDLKITADLLKLFLRVILIIVFLKLGYGVIALACILFLSDTVGYILYFLFAKKTASYLSIKRQVIDISKLKILYKYSWKTFLAQVADKLRFDIDNFVIVVFLGLNFVPIYVIAARLIRYFIDFVLSALGMLIPVFSQYEAKNNYKAIREKFVFTTKLSCYLSIFIGAVFIVFGRAFIQRWMGAEYLGAYPLLMILVVPTAGALMQVPSLQLLYGISKHKFFAISNTAEGISNLLLSVILVQKIGLIGVALGTAIPMLIVTLFIRPVYVCRSINLSVKLYYVKVVLPVLAKCIGASFMFFYISRFLIGPNYLHLIFLIASMGLLFAMIGYYSGFSKSEKQYLQVIFKRN